MDQQGYPEEIRIDQGCEFRNRKVKDLQQGFGVRIHYSTGGHSQSHSAVEILHCTITEQPRLLKIGKRIVGDEALARAILANNETIHSTTNHTPRDVAARTVDPTLVKAKVVADKLRHFNENNTRSRDPRAEDIGLGMKVFRRNLCERKKSDLRYTGPYRVIEALDRHGVKLVREADNIRPLIVQRLDLKSTRPRGQQVHQESGHEDEYATDDERQSNSIDSKFLLFFF